MQPFQDHPFAPEMIALPAGRFTMGRGSGAELRLFEALGVDLERDLDLDQEPAHLVRLAYPVAMARYAVTFDEYDRFAKAVGRPLPEESQHGRGDLPVVNVSWLDAQAYACWLSGVTGQVYRLPSEAEWEYAARAGTTTTYWWGDHFDGTGVCWQESPGCGPFPVRTFEPNPWGLFNMLGNVNEWVEDCYHAHYLGAPDDGSPWVLPEDMALAPDCSVRVLRGGGWRSEPEGLTCTYRDRGDVEFAISEVGFRLARVMSPQSDWFYRHAWRWGQPYPATP